MTNTGSMLRSASKRSALACAMCLAGWPDLSTAQGLASAPVRGYSQAAPTNEVVRGVVRAMYQNGVFEGVIGFENLGNPAHVVSVAAAKAELGAVLGAICDQDPEYRVVSGDSPFLINILPTDTRAPGHEVLEFKIPKLDLTSTNCRRI